MIRQSLGIIIQKCFENYFQSVLFHDIGSEEGKGELAHAQIDFIAMKHVTHPE